jgi:hypothetical protein
MELMLGLLMARYLNRPEKAREYLLRASAKLMDENSRRLAREALEKLDEQQRSGGASVPGVQNS